jgi:hypothetical protein
MGKEARYQREVLNIRQMGLSPLTGKPLRGKRLERHHIEERYIGGSDEVENIQLLPIAEHLVDHLNRSFLASTEEERLREVDIVMGRIKELKPEELTEFNDLVPKLTGKRVKFF